MREWLEAQLRNGLPAFQGSKASGSIAVSQEFVNDLLTSWLRDGDRSATPPPDLGQLKRMITRAEVRAEAGRIAIDFAIEVTPSSLT